MATDRQFIRECQIGFALVADGDVVVFLVSSTVLVCRPTMPCTGNFLPVSVVVHEEGSENAAKKAAKGTEKGYAPRGKLTYVGSV
jgi:hypothetical protein